MPEKASVGDAVPLRTLPHPAPFPKGEGKNVGVRDVPLRTLPQPNPLPKGEGKNGGGHDVPLRIFPHPDPLPKGEGKNVGGPDVPLRILSHPDPLPKGEGNCTSETVGKNLPRIRKYADRNEANEIIRYNNCRSFIPHP